MKIDVSTKGPHEQRRRRASRRLATIRDVAKRAGVSTATVSRSLASPDLVSEEARARVLEAIRATGYTPNVAARNLRAKRAMIILVAVPKIANDFFAEVLRGIDDALVAHGYGIIIGNLDNLEERESRYVDLVYSGQVDGVLLMDGRMPSRNGRLMSDAGVPMATICVEIPNGNLPSIMVDDNEATLKVVEHLISLGHRSFGYISGPQGNQNEIGRRAGFVAALSAAGLDPRKAVYWPGDFTIATGVAAARDFLARKDRPTAVYAVSDTMAIGFLKTVTDAGVAVPEELSVVGFDDIEFSEFVTPALTTIRQPRHEIGHTAALVLIEALSTGQRPRRVRLDAPLIVRKSTARAPARMAAKLRRTG